MKLWGKAVPNTTVNVTPSWNNQTITAQSDNEGRWQVSIQTPAADFTPYSIEFSDGEITRIQNILIGEVWFCSGQSNMEMPLNGFWNCPIEHANETIATSGEWNAIRMATIPKTGALTPQELCQRVVGKKAILSTHLISVQPLSTLPGCCTGCFVYQ